MISDSTITSIIECTADTHWAAHDGGTEGRAKIEGLIQAEIDKTASLPAQSGSVQCREDVARAVCCGEHDGGCILRDCEPHEGEEIACIALKGYHDKTIDAVLAVLALPQHAGQPPCWPSGFHELEYNTEATDRGCVMFFDTHEQRNKFMKWFTAEASAPVSPQPREDNKS